MKHMTIRRLGFALAALLLAALSLLASASIVASRLNPALALVLWPANGNAAARVGDQAMLLGYVQREKEPGSEAEEMRRAARFARRSLETLALNPVALRTIGMTEFEGQPGQAEVIRQAARLSRRDSLTQLWLINDAVRANESHRALQHYDALLRRDTPFRDLAGRTLAHALSEPRFVESIGDLLRDDPPWKSLFYHYAVRDPAAWDGFLRLHGSLAESAGVPVETSAEFAAALAAAGRIEDASAVAAQAGAKPLTRATGLTDTQFASDTPFPGNWQVPDANGSSLQPLADGGALLSYPRARTGTLARRLIALAPGTYRANLRIEEGAEKGADGGARPEARLSCVSGRAEFASPVLTIGPDCPYQWLAIVMPQAPRYDGEVYLQSVGVDRDG